MILFFQYFYREFKRIAPLNAPNVENAIKTGAIHAKLIGKIFSLKV